MGDTTTNTTGAEQRKAKLAAAREQAAELGLEGLDKAPLAQVEKAIKDHQAAAESGADGEGGSSGPPTTPTPASSSEPTTHKAPSISARAIDVPQRRRDRPSNAKRAESRGTYRDQTGRARIVGAGEPIPDGWTRESDADLADRARTVGGENVNPHISGDLPEDKARRGPRGR